MDYIVTFIVKINFKMSKTNGSKTSKRKPNQTTCCEINNESFTMTDMDKIMLEIMCEKLMDSMDHLYKKMGSHQEKSSYLDIYMSKKELLESLIYPKEQSSDIQILNQIVN